MSPAFRNTLDAILIAALCFFVWLASANARLHREALDRELESGCVAPEQARVMKAACVTVSKR